ncbi:MAG TPA: phenylacetate--CoA ligase, partial [Paludibacteraceae bacterium]|nr:phenylacetate--CoA ligase [Paludibacteraceae bacterium]
MIWNEEIECMSSSEMRKLQSERLKELVNKVYQNVEFYRKKMDEKGIRPSDIRSIDDISKLPFTNKT